MGVTAPGPALDPAALAADLMAIDSTSGREGAVVEHARALLAARGWAVTSIPVSEGRADLLARSGAAPLVTLSTHLDTVAPHLPPRLAGGRLYGRGACDAKGIAAAMICAAERLRDRGVPVALLLVVGEETLHDGARAADAFPTTSRVLIDGEPTGSALAIACKGSLRFTVRVEGQAAHSAYPHLGRSAIDALVELLHDLRRLPLPADPLLGETTINVGRIEGGVADNVVAPFAQARLMARTATPAAELRALLAPWAAGRAGIEWGLETPPLHLGRVEGFDTAVMAYTTDIPLLTRWGTPYLFGPGSIHVAHREDEHVAVDELRAAVGAYERLAVAALAAEGIRWQ